MSDKKCTYFDVCKFAGDDSPQCSKNEGVCAIRGVHNVVTDLSRRVV